jgi:hypothetical protein
MTVIYEKEAPKQGKIRLHEIVAPHGYTGYILHARRGNDVLYFALTKGDLVALRDSINGAIGG